MSTLNSKLIIASYNHLFAKIIEEVIMQNSKLYLLRNSCISIYYIPLWAQDYLMLIGWIFY